MRDGTPNPAPRVGTYKGGMRLMVPGPETLNNILAERSAGNTAGCAVNGCTRPNTGFSTIAQAEYPPPPPPTPPL